MCDYGDYFYDTQYDDNRPDYFDYVNPYDYDCYLSSHEFDVPDDFELFHELHGSADCGQYGVSYGAVDAGVHVSSLGANL